MSAARSPWRHLPVPVGAAFAALLVLAGAVERLDLAAWDLVLPLFRSEPPEDIVVVAIDEPSLRAFGRWPWPRRLHAEILRRIDAAGARAIGYDVVFAEPDPRDPEGDRALVVELLRLDRVVLPVFPDQPVAGGPPIEILPMPPLRGAVRLGHVDVEVGADGLVRGTFLRAGLGAAVRPGFAEAVLDAAAGRPPPGEAAAGSRSGWVRADPVLVPFAGPPGHFRRIPASALLRQPEEAGQVLRGALVLVGATAPGLGDVLPTPVSAASHPMPGVEFNAHVLTGLRAGGLVRPLPAAASAALAATLAGLLLLSGGARPLAAFLATPPAAVAVALVLLFGARIWWSPVAVLLVVPVVLGARDLVGRIAERRRIRLEHARAHVTLHAIDEGVITLDEDDRILQVNPAAVRLLGRPAGQLAGRRFGEVVRLRPLAGGEQPQLFELEASDGPPRIVELRRRALPAAGRRQWVVTLADRTEEFRSRRELEAGRNRLRQLERELERETRRGAMAQLAAAIAHEVNQPLSAILTYANAGRRLARREAGELKSGVVESLDKLAEQAERAGEVVRRLRSLFEGGGPRPEPSDPNRIVAEALELVRSEFPGAAVEADFDLDLPEVPLDRIQIQQLVRNLVKNALEARGGGEPRCVRVRTAREGGGLVLEVVDNGPGIPPELRGRLFEPFATGRARGLGVGLALCRQIAEAHGGSIEYRDVAGGGACFRVILPLASDGSSHGEGKDGDGGSGLRGR